MNSLLRSPAFLLVTVGSLLGFNFPLGKIAASAGVPSIVWAALISLSVSGSLGVLLILRRTPVPLDARHLRYFAATAVVSYAVPNVLVFAAIPHLGSGLTAIFFTLSPILTVAFSALAGLRRPHPFEFAGIGVALAGALLVVSGRGEIGRPADLIWIAAGLLVPVSLAFGNVYRTIDWPKDADPLWLAVGSNAVSAVLLAMLALATTDLGSFLLTASIPGTMFAQALSSSLMFLLFFRLQKYGGPVTLSQIGGVAAAVGIGIGTLLLNERYPQVVWSGVAIIGVGLALTVAAKMRSQAG